MPRRSKPSHPPKPSDVTADRSGDGVTLFFACVLTLAALLPCVVPFSPAIYFAGDPRLHDANELITSLGPTGQVWWMTLLIALAACGLGWHARLRRRVVWWTVGIAVAVSAAGLYQMWSVAANILPVGATVAATWAAVAMHHLAQQPRVRRWAAALLLAMAMPFVIESATYVLLDHPMTVANFESNRQASLEQRGMEPGSHAAKTFERRLSDNAAVGAFGLSNVYGTVCAGITLFAGGCAFFGLLRERKHPIHILLACLGVVALVTLLMTQSKGATLAAVAAGGVIMAACVFCRSIAARRLLPWACVALVGVAFAAVLMRGAMGPPQTSAGERSLLFRYHYWIGAARVMADATVGDLLIGVGPATFHEHYPRVKPAINPEEVQSAHNVLVDHVLMFGVVGVLLSGMLLVWLVLAARRAMRSAGEGPSTPVHSDRPWYEPSRQTVTVALLCGIVLFGAEAVVRSWSLLTYSGVLGWFAGLAGFVVVVSILVDAEAWSGRTIRFGLAAALLVVLTHSQIEMAFYQGNAVAVVMLIAGVASAGGARAPSTKGGFVAAGVGLVTVLAMAVFIAVPLTKHQGQLATAEAQLQRRDARAAIASLTRAADVLPTDLTAYRWQVALWLEGAQAYHGRGQAATVASMLAQAIAAAERAQVNAPEARLQVDRMFHAIYQVADGVDGSRPWQQLELELLADMTALRPHDLDLHLRMADLLWLEGRQDEAERLYRRCLEIDANYYLDPLRQLEDAERRELRMRLGLTP